MEILNHQVKMQHKRKGGTEREREKENGTIIINLNAKFVLKSINSIQYKKYTFSLRHTLSAHGIQESLCQIWYL